MRRHPNPGCWDALVVTASDRSQAARYEEALDRRRQLDLLGDVGEVMVVPDPDGRRVGSGGSTIFALAEVLARLAAKPGRYPSDCLARRTPAGRLAAALAGLRVLIIHGGGDCRRLPAYATCGKVFMPLPGRCDSIEPLTLFDRQLPVYVSLPPPQDCSGQIVIAAGDVLLLFDSSAVDLTGPGLTGTACYAGPGQAAGHGVFCDGGSGAVRMYLQKASEEEQRAQGAVDDLGRSLLDIGLMGFDHDFAARLLAMAGFDAVPAGQGFSVEITNANEITRAILARGLDVYCEIACALGGQTDFPQYLQAVRSAGSNVEEGVLREIFRQLHDAPFHFRLAPRCRFLHFGTSRHVIESGLELVEDEKLEPIGNQPVTINCLLDGGVNGGAAWVESCSITTEVRLGGQNLLVGVDARRPLRLEPGIVVDVAPARPSPELGIAEGAKFVRIYGVHDTFKAGPSCTFLNAPIAGFLSAMRAFESDIWPEDGTRERSLWDAKLFPLVRSDEEVHDWLWMQHPAAATAQQRRAWSDTRRYSIAEMASLIDAQAETLNRRRLCRESMGRRLPSLMAPDSWFSAKDLARWLIETDEPGGVVSAMMRRAGECRALRQGKALEAVRILHSLGSALEAAGPMALTAGPGGCEAPRPCDLKSLAFTLVADAVGSQADGAARPGSDLDSIRAEAPRILLRSDEIVWARSPVRVDLAGGWTDTPPYTLEHGGRVVNSAVWLNDQPPIHVYVRPLAEPVIRIASIDLGTRIEVRSLEGLLDYRSPASGFSLVKGALVLMGFAPQSPPWRDGIGLPGMLSEAGAGLEISTLCAIPKGSGLGTSSILGATLIAALARARGLGVANRALFELVLRLEQMLTTGGGWQDQVGGALPGVKFIFTDPGLHPDPVAYYLPSDLLCPSSNGGTTLLYYTGVTRVAKNILQQVVGRYLDRDRTVLRVLDGIARLADEMRDALSLKDPARFGGLVDRAWQLNKALDPNSTTPEVEHILETIRPHVHGAKLLGAGGGGFLLIVAKSRTDARRVRRKLEAAPVNGRARFFEFRVSTEGLVVTTS